MKSYIYFLIALLLTLSACDSYNQDDFEPEYVVESYLIAGEPLPEVRLSQTSTIHQAYRFEDFAVGGARVKVMLLNEQGEVEETINYQLGREGIYLPVLAHEVRPLRRYALEVQPAGEAGLITASTLVPGMFDLDELAETTIVYQEGDALALNMTQSVYPGRPAIYINKVEALDTSYALTPLYQDLVDDGEIDKEDVIDNSSGIMNEANFEAYAEDKLTLIVPWIGIAYYGPNALVVDAVDDNVFDFMRSIEENGARPLGERENVIDHVEGGRGIFGSLARARTQVFVEHTGLNVQDSD